MCVRAYFFILTTTNNFFKIRLLKEYLKHQGPYLQTLNEEKGWIGKTLKIQLLD